nr:FAR1 DNA binding domain, zinc finger, SWIM-type, MULE transposase domain, FHY3/FAR1 family [Tanacetum cinerariifolium]
MGDEHLDTILITKSDEVIKSSVENLVPIPSESEGIPDTMCDVHLVNNSTPLEAKNHFEIVINSNADISSSDDDSLYNENIEYVEASSHDPELVSLEVAEIVTPEGMEKQMVMSKDQMCKLIITFTYIVDATDRYKNIVLSRRDLHVLRHRQLCKRFREPVVRSLEFVIRCLEGSVGDDLSFIQVDLCKSAMEVECSCEHYEVYDLLCRYNFYVLKMNNIKEFPQKSLNKRWLKNVKPFNIAIPLQPSKKIKKTVQPTRTGLRTSKHFSA